MPIGGEALPDPQPGAEAPQPRLGVGLGRLLESLGGLELGRHLRAPGLRECGLLLRLRLGSLRRVDGAQ